MATIDQFVIHRIISYLDLGCILDSCRFICKHWNQAISHQNVWHTFFCTKTGVAIPFSKSALWKELYFKLFYRYIPHEIMKYRMDSKGGELNTLSTGELKAYKRSMEIFCHQQLELIPLLCGDHGISCHFVDAALSVVCTTSYYRGDPAQVNDICASFVAFSKENPARYALFCVSIVYVNASIEPTSFVSVDTRLCNLLANEEGQAENLFFINDGDPCTVSHFDCSGFWDPERVGKSVNFEKIRAVREHLSFRVPSEDEEYGPRTADVAFMQFLITKAFSTKYTPIPPEADLILCKREAEKMLDDVISENIRWQVNLALQSDFRRFIERVKITEYEKCFLKWPEFGYYGRKRVKCSFHVSGQEFPIEILMARSRMLWNLTFRHGSEYILGVTAADDHWYSTNDFQALSELPEKLSLPDATPQDIFDLFVITAGVYYNVQPGKKYEQIEDLPNKRQKTSWVPYFPFSSAEPLLHETIIPFRARARSIMSHIGVYEIAHARLFRDFWPNEIVSEKCDRDTQEEVAEEDPAFCHPSIESPTV